MDLLLRKLQHKQPAPVTLVGTVPPEVRPLIDAWPSDVKVKRRLGKDEAFVLAFVRSRADIAKQAPRLAAALASDGVLWVAYPKKASKRYSSDVGRDDSFQPLGDLGFEGVRQIAVDDDWSALRFRRAEHIKAMKRDRSGAMSRAGKRRTAKGGLGGRGGPAATSPATPSRRPPDQKRPTPPEVEAFIAGLPADRREALTAVHEVVRKAVPEQEPHMWNTMIGYGRYPYRGASGREGEWFAIGLANQKRYVSLYLCAGTEDGYLAEMNAKRLGNVSVGRSCVRFTKLENIDLDVVAELAQEAVELLDAGELRM